MKWNNPDFTDSKSTGVQSVIRAINVLVCLSSGIDTLTDIANYCKLSKSTVHRLLKTLEESHFVVQDPLNNKYYLGNMINQIISKPLIANKYLISCSYEEMVHLFEVSEETVTLHIMIGLQDIPLHRIVSKHDLRVMGEVGWEMDRFSGATRKVLLSQLGDNELKLLIRNIKAKPAKEYAIIDEETLTMDIRRVRKQGYSVSIGETIVGSIGMSAPIMNYIYPAALSVFGPADRLKSRVDNLKEELKESANRISSKITGGA